MVRTVVSARLRLCQYNFDNFEWFGPFRALACSYANIIFHHFEWFGPFRALACGYAKIILIILNGSDRFERSLARWRLCDRCDNHYTTKTSLPPRGHTGNPARVDVPWPNKNKFTTCLELLG